MVKNLSSSPHESCGRDLGTISWNFLVQNPHEETSNDRFHEPPAVLVWRLYQEFWSDLCRGLPVILPLASLIACRRFTQLFWETPRKHWKHPETLETHRNTQFLHQNWVRRLPLLCALLLPRTRTIPSSSSPPLHVLRKPPHPLWTRSVVVIAS